MLALPAFWEAKVGGLLKARSSRPAQATQQDLISTKKKKLAECSGATLAHSNLHLLDSSDSPASASRVAGITGIIFFVFFGELGCHHLGQAGLLTSRSANLGLPKCWDHRREPMHPAIILVFKKAFQNQQLAHYFHLREIKNLLLIQFYAFSDFKYTKEKNSDVSKELTCLYLIITYVKQLSLLLV